MRKLLHFDSPVEVYRADACVICCFDARPDLAVRKFLKRRGIAWYDLVKIAGGAKALASPAQESEREFAINQVRLSRKLHDTDRVLLFAHADCGAYGGSAALGGSAEAEAAFHAGELARASALIRQAVPGIAVECYFVAFDGVWEVPAARAV